MKDWQKNIPLDTLLELEQLWEGYNQRTLSPFLEMKKHTIARTLSEGTYTYGKTWAMVSRVSKSKTQFNMYSAYKIPIATIVPDDCIVEKIAYTDSQEMIKALNIQTENVYLLINEEHQLDREVATTAGFCKVGIKINTFGDIQGLYFRDKQSSLAFGGREFPEQRDLLPEEKLVLTKAKLSDVTESCQLIYQRLCDFDYTFTNHYSNYNKDKSWSAISLRGYTADGSFITKPAEMSKVWKEKHKDEVFELQDTTLRKKFPEAEHLIRLLPGSPHRIRFMNLKPGGGELQRHTDQVDPDAGVMNNKLMRFHFPIVTNPDVIFNQWDWNANLVEVHMRVGECWYIDVRKPHRAINGGTEMRTHLVIDVEANTEVRSLIC